MITEPYPPCLSRNLVRIGRAEYTYNMPAKMPAIAAVISARCGQLQISGITALNSMHRQGCTHRPTDA